MRKFITDKTIISTCTLVSSLATYYYSKSQAKDGVPYVMIGGFIGAWCGEMITKTLNTKNNK